MTSGEGAGGSRGREGRGKAGEQEWRTHGHRQWGSWLWECGGQGGVSSGKKGGQL